MMLQAAVASSPHAALVVLSFFTPNSSSDKVFTKNQWFS
jgi:hypothetical protein